MATIAERIAQSLKNGTKCDLCGILGEDKICSDVEGQESREVVKGSKKVIVPGKVRQCFMRSKFGELHIMATSFTKKVDRIWEEEKAKKVPVGQ